MIRIQWGVPYTQAYGCRFCIHVACLAIYLGRWRGYGARLELLTIGHRFRFTRGSKSP